MTRYSKAPDVRWQAGKIPDTIVIPRDQTPPLHTSNGEHRIDVYLSRPGDVLTARKFLRSASCRITDDSILIGKPLFAEVVKLLALSLDKDQQSEMVCSLWLPEPSGQDILIFVCDVKNNWPRVPHLNEPSESIH